MSEALASRFKLKSVEILNRKRVINDFSMYRFRSGGRRSLSFSRNDAFLVYDSAYLLAHPAMLVTSRSFGDPNARWRWPRKLFNRRLPYQQYAFIIIGTRFEKETRYINYNLKITNIYTVNNIYKWIIKKRWNICLQKYICKNAYSLNLTF